MRDESHPHVEPQTMREAVQQALSEASHLLPDQAPIRVFIHHNTLHAFQHLPFHQAVQRAYQVYGAQPYLSEEAFRKHLQTGRIAEASLRAVLAEAYPEDRPLLGGALTEQQLYLAMMQHAISTETEASLRFVSRELHAMHRLREDLPSETRAQLVADSTQALKALLARKSKRELAEFARLATGELAPARAEAALSARVGHACTPGACLHALEHDPEGLAATALWATSLEAAQSHVDVAHADVAPERLLPREAALKHTGFDIYDLLFPALIRLCAAYLDDGVAHWSMPFRAQGFYLAVRELVGHGSHFPERWLNDVARQFRAQETQALSAQDVIEQALDSLGVRPSEVCSFVERLLLTLPGWAGLVSRLERNPEDRPVGGAPASLLEFLAVRLTYELCATREVLVRAGRNELDLQSLLRGSHVAEPKTLRSPPMRAYQLFQLMQVTGMAYPHLKKAGRGEVQSLFEAQDAFTPLLRRMLFQEAFERQHRHQILDALASHRRCAKLERPAVRPAFQAIFCFDEREESIRRHLEEVCPEVETFGAPGFFGAAMRFRALDEPRHVPLAPVVLKPVHHVEEKPHADQQRLSASRKKRQRAWAQLAHHAHIGTRSLWRGTALNLALGLLSVFPLLTRVTSPHMAGSIRRWLLRKVLPAPRTELSLHHDLAGDPGIVRGFPVDERVSRVATVLENIGFTAQFSKLILLIGHGSTTRNNPHKSAYDCGACGGRQGGPNARAVAQMANDPDVRRCLTARGIYIPDDTLFVGGQHDTCSDEIQLFDTDRIPHDHRELFEDAVEAFDRARARNAQERCRRLFSAPKASTPVRALRHVEARAEHLAEPRPEFGHATNAIAVIGRRGLTRDLFLDRRAFLLSYDPSIDTDGRILERTLAAATPVGAGINLEYYFSHVDNEHYGAGSKLPHNVTGLVGVMTGHASDLRTGLPRQMIEIHEPVRLLVIVEATPERLVEITTRQAEVRELVVNRWVQLVSLDPDTGAMQVFTDLGFVPYTPESVVLPECATSKDFYFRKEGFLPPARINANGTKAA